MRSLDTQSVALKTLFLILFVLFSGYWAYLVVDIYFASPSHAISPIAGFWLPLVLSFVGFALYQWYRFHRLSTSGSTNGISIWQGTLAFIGIHFLVCVAYGGFVVESAQGQQISASMIALSTWIKSLGFAVLPLMLLWVTSATGFRLLGFLGLHTGARISRSSMILLSVALGMAGYLILLSLIWALGWFHLPVVWLITIAYALIGMGSYGPGARALIASSTHKITERSDLARSMIRHAFGVAVMIFFASFFISILRPFPIGWDDLGVYMNYPRLIALSGESAQMGLIAWQHFTAIGFLFSSPTQAFYLSELGGLMMLIATYLGLKVLLDEHTGKTSVAPMVWAAAIISLPMVVFHLAKDMKVDPALYTLSVAALVALCLAFRLDRRWAGLSDTTMIGWKEYIALPQSRLIIIAGLLTGVAFAVKLTTLMLLISGMAMIAFRYTRKTGLVALIFSVFGVFTMANLWKFLNLDILSSEGSLRIAVGGLLLALSGLLLLSILLSAHRARLRTMGVMLTLFVGSFALSMSPWLIKNLVEVSFAPTSLSQVIYGKSQAFVPDLTRIYTPEELEQKEKERLSHITSASGKTANEDLGRYMGYEEWLNNALKLPRNLTTQVNQGGEFTNIWFFFLALVPLASLALFRHRLIGLGVLSMLVFLSLYYFAPGAEANLSAVFGRISYPLGYALLFALVMIAMIALLVSYRRSSEDSESDHAHIRDIRAIVVAISVYGMLFWVSSFGIVWYGILIYFLFLVVIFAGMRLIDRELNTLIGDRLHLMTSASVMLIGFFVFIVAIPHAWSNIKTSGYLEYKIGAMTSEAASFAYRGGNLEVLSRLNVADQKQAVTTVIQAARQDQIKETIARYQPQTLTDLDAILTQIERQLSGSQLSALYLSDIATLRSALYRYILTPPEDNLNQDKIYRIGTFLTYYIRNNHQRYLDDSLVMEYERIIASSDDDLAAKRLEWLGVNHLLLDLNAATIDRDPTRKLTTRYEGLLANMRSDRLNLVYTDSPCLELALYKKKSLSREDYLLLAHTNSESYLSLSGSSQKSIISRTQKLSLCRSEITEILMSSDTTQIPAFLRPYKSYLTAEKITDRAKVSEIVTQIVPNQSWMALFEIKKGSDKAESNQ